VIALVLCCSLDSGGTNLTVVGEHLDSVVYPEMVVYLTQQGVPIGQLFTVSRAINCKLVMSYK